MDAFEDAFDLGKKHGGVKPIPTVAPDPTHYEKAGDDGFRALWIVFAVMVISSFVFTLMAWKITVSRRLYHVITTIITLTAAISYFAMASGDATSFSCNKVKESHKHVPDTHHEVCRQVFWGRYVDWAITTPLLLVDLCLLAGIDGAHMTMAIVADLIMILTGLFAAFGREHTIQKWGWYTIACIAYIFVIWHVAVHGSRTVKVRSERVGKLFGSLAAFTLILWTLYPIVWGLGEGAHRLSVNGEIISYAILDILAKPVFGFWLLLSHQKIPETNVEVGGFWAHGFNSEGRIRIGEEEGA